MSWKVTQQQRAKGPYYTVVWTPLITEAGQKAKARTWTIGYRTEAQRRPEGDTVDWIGPPSTTIEMAERLTASRLSLVDAERYEARDAEWAAVPPKDWTERIDRDAPPMWVGQLRMVCFGGYDMSKSYFFQSGLACYDKVPEPSPKRRGAVNTGQHLPGVPLSPEGTMTLRRYQEEVWTPIRSQKKATWDRESWWWEERILPALGGVRLCDLNATRWSEFLATLTTCGGRSKGLCQTAYRTALTHAVHVLKWVSGHNFADIQGSTKRTLAEPEPMLAEEVGVFLDAAPSPMHRALFALQIGQGLRPDEVIQVMWEDVDWTRGLIFIRGTKNDLAKGTVPLTPVSVPELRRYWMSLGSPEAGVAFERMRGGGPFPEYPDSAFYSTAKRSGLNLNRTRKLFPYVARHTFATLAATAGIDRAHTKAIMRHSRESTILDEAYIRVSKQQTANAFVGFVLPDAPVRTPSPPLGAGPQVGELALDHPVQADRPQKS